jgi:hypothetical protein
LLVDRINSNGRFRHNVAVAGVRTTLDLGAYESNYVFVDGFE